MIEIAGHFDDLHFNVALIESAVVRHRDLILVVKELGLSAEHPAFHLFGAHAPICEMVFTQAVLSRRHQWRYKGVPTSTDGFYPLEVITDFDHRAGDSATFERFEFDGTQVDPPADVEWTVEAVAFLLRLDPTKGG